MELADCHTRIAPLRGLSFAPLSVAFISVQLTPTFTVYGVIRMVRQPLASTDTVLPASSTASGVIVVLYATCIM